MEEKDYKIIEANDLTLEDKWDILTRYLEFVEKAMIIQCITETDKVKTSEISSNAATIATVRTMMNSNENLIRCEADMQREEVEFVHLFPLPPLAD